MANSEQSTKRGNWWVWLILFVLAAGLGIGLIWYFGSGDQPAPPTTQSRPETTTARTPQTTGPSTTEAKRVIDLPKLAQKKQKSTEQPTLQTDMSPGSDSKSAIKETDIGPASPDRKSEPQKARGSIPKPKETVPPPDQAGTESASKAPRQSVVKDTEDDMIAEQAKRKEELGLKESVEAVVKEEEVIRIGRTKVQMGDIAAKIRSDQTVDGSGSGDRKTSPPKPEPSLFGVRLVRQGDNLWNIHFKVLKEYFAHHGIRVSAEADEPQQSGQSSGVGRILKFAERMVHIYNVRTGQLCDNLDLIHPNEKIVIFNMSRLDRALRHLSADDIKKLRFDGTNLYVEEQ